MPWKRRGRCVHEKRPDGSTGKLVKCSETVQQARAYMQALYANLPENEKAMSDLSGYVYLLLRENYQIEQIQVALRVLFQQDSQVANSWDINWESSYNWHTTLVYCISVTDEQLMEAMKSAPRVRPIIKSTRLDVFENGDERALHLVVEPDGRLLELQRSLYNALKAQGVELSPFSNPEVYKPHITLAYLPSGISVPNLDVNLDVLADCIEAERDEYRPVASVYFNEWERHITPEQRMYTTKAQVLEKAITYTDEGDLVIPVIGIPFKGVIEGKRDLAGDYFHKNTDVGPLQEVMAFYDHGKDELYIEKELKSLGYSDEQIKSLGDIGFGKHDIGVARRGETTQDGIIYNVIVRRRTRYFKALERAAKEGLIDASSRALTRIDDPNVPGKIDYWATAEISLSPTPMSPTARSLLAKSIAEAFMGDQPQNGSEVTERNQTTAEQNQSEAISSTPIADAVNELLKGDEKSSGDGETTLVRLLKSISDTLVALDGRLQKVEERMGAAEAKSDSVEKAVKDFNTDMNTAVQAMARQIASFLRGTITDEVQKSKLERVQDQIIDKKLNKSANGQGANVPSNWDNFPGAN